MSREASIENSPVGDAARGAHSMIHLGFGPLEPGMAAGYHLALTDQSRFPELMLDYYDLAARLLRERANSEGVEPSEILRRIAGE